MTRPRVEIATALTISEWNQGSLATQQFMDELGICKNLFSQQLGQRRDKKRLKQADGAVEVAAKRRREIRKSAIQRDRRRMELDDRNAGRSYAAGGGDYI